MPSPTFLAGHNSDVNLLLVFVIFSTKLHSVKSCQPKTVPKLIVNQFKNVHAHKHKNALKNVIEPRRRLSITHKLPPYKMYPKKGSRKIHKKIPSHEMNGEYVILRRKKLYEINKLHGRDPDFFLEENVNRIFQHSSHDMEKDDVKNVY